MALAWILAGLLAQVVVAEKPQGAMVCLTTEGMNPVVHVPTSTTTIFVTATKTTTSNAHLTTTLLKDKTSSATTPAGSPVTTKTVTTTKTITVSSTSTKTVPTSSGFKPVRSTLPMAEAKLNAHQAPPVDAVSSVRPQYAQKVDCRVHSTTTTTVTIYGKEAPPSAVIADSDVASVTTKTVTKTTTTTDIVAGPTIYAACLEDNMYTYPGARNTFYAVTGTADYNVYSQSLNTSYECCVECLTVFHCAGGIFQPATPYIESYCQFVALSSKVPQSSRTLSAVYATNTPVYGYPIFNGDCGEIVTAIHDQ